MKKIIRGFVGILFFATFAIGSASAFDPMNRAEGIQDSSVFVNAGVGFPTKEFFRAIDYGRYFKTHIPPLVAAVDFRLPVNVPLSVGAHFSIDTYDEITARPDGINIHGYGQYFNIGARAAWHFDFGVKNLDTYAGIVLGIELSHQQGSVTNRNNAFPPRNFEETTSNFFGGGHIGARYFFTNTIGMFAEVGYNNASLATLGLALKF